MLTAVAVLASPHAAAAPTKAELDASLRRLRTLESEITTREAQVRGLQANVREASSRVERGRADAAAVQRQLQSTRRELARTQAEHTSLRNRLDARARAVYVQGPASTLGLVLGSQSLLQLTSRIAFAARLIRQDTDLSLKVARAAAQLEERRAAEAALLAQKADALRRVRGEQKAVEASFARAQNALGGLVRARVELNQIIRQLRDKLRAEELARFVRVAGKGMTITFGQWAQAFLSALGAPASRGNLVAVVAWETAEYTEATWNPLATTYNMPGATVFNSHGVKNYGSKEQGIEASILTLRRPNHGYEAIVSNLRAGSDAMTTARAINASDWCRGCAGGNYVVGLIPAVEAYYDRYAGA